MSRYYPLRFFTQEQWRQLVLNKEQFLAGDEEVLHNNPFLSSDLAMSWLRSKRRGIDPYQRWIKPQISIHEYETLKARHHRTIEAARSLLDMLDIFKDTSLPDDFYTISLWDANGAFLYERGDNMLRMKTEGLIWNEETVGTCALWYCVSCRRPVQLVGPEHYSAALNDIIVTAAPILDEQGQISSVLTLGQFMPERPCEESFQKHRLHTMLLAIALAKAMEGRIRLQDMNQEMTKQYAGARVGGNTAAYSFTDIIGEDPAFKKTVRLAERFAHSAENILIVGESGTGKELFAHAIHNIYRPQGPFVALNCAAMPRGLVESELFGYEGGSFTGAQKGGKPGKIEIANGGTLFLDEIGEMPLKLQSTLLRILEDKQVMRIGSSWPRKVDFRLIAATNADLRHMVISNDFRKDLFFRLSVLVLQLPPLRDRSEDIELLSRSFLHAYCVRQGRKTPRLTANATAFLKAYDWPGNARQLQNAMIHALHMATGDVIEKEHLSEYMLYKCVDAEDMDPAAAPKAAAQPTLLEVEKQAIRRALASTGHNVPEAAKMLGISRSNLYSKLKEYLSNTP
jgi:transcriptional regulator with PAS, ATPase and Fis domain